MRVCSVENCGRKHYIKGYCEKHSDRFKKHGNTDIGMVRKHKINEDFFKVLNRESCWVLGWLATDGYISEDKNYISLQITDREILEKIKILMSYDGPITIRNPKKNESTLYRLRVCSKELVKDCVKLGIRQKKSLNLSMPYIKDEFKMNFLTGVVEGDGSIVLRKRGKNNNYLDFKIYICSASLVFINNLRDEFKYEWSFSKDIRKKCNPVYRITLYGEKALEFCNDLYKDSENLRLDRKHQKYLEYKNYIENKDANRYI